MLWDLIAENKLREAISDGLFKNLPGAGKPLRWEDDALVPPGWRAAFHLLRQSGLAPNWIALDVGVRSDLRAARQAFGRTAARWGKGDSEFVRGAEQLARKVIEINRAIDELNLRVPSPQLTRLHLDPEIEIARIVRAAAMGKVGRSDRTESEAPS